MMYDEHPKLNGWVLLLVFMATGIFAVLSVFVFSGTGDGVEEGRVGGLEIGGSRAETYEAISGMTVGPIFPNAWEEGLSDAVHQEGKAWKDLSEEEKGRLLSSEIWSFEIWSESLREVTPVMELTFRDGRLARIERAIDPLMP